MVILDESSNFGDWAEMWGSKKTVGKKYTYYRSIRSFLNHLKPIYDIPVGNVKTMHMKALSMNWLRTIPTQVNRLLRNFLTTSNLLQGQSLNMLSTTVMSFIRIEQPQLKFQPNHP